MKYILNLLNKVRTFTAMQNTNMKHTFSELTICVAYLMLSTFSIQYFYYTIGEKFDLTESFARIVEPNHTYRIFITLIISSFCWLSGRILDHNLSKFSFVGNNRKLILIIFFLLMLYFFDKFGLQIYGPRHATISALATNYAPEVANQHIVRIFVPALIFTFSYTYTHSALSPHSTLNSYVKTPWTFAIIATSFFVLSTIYVPAKVSVKIDDWEFVKLVPMLNTEYGPLVENRHPNAQDKVDHMDMEIHRYDFDMIRTYLKVLIVENPSEILEALSRANVPLTAYDVVEDENRKISNFILKERGSAGELKRSIGDRECWSRLYITHDLRDGFLPTSDWTSTHPPKIILRPKRVKENIINTQHIFPIFSQGATSQQTRHIQEAAPTLFFSKNPKIPQYFDDRYWGKDNVGFISNRPTEVIIQKSVLEFEFSCIQNLNSDINSYVTFLVSKAKFPRNTTVFVAALNNDISFVLEKQEPLFFPASFWPTSKSRKYFSLESLSLNGFVFNETESFELNFGQNIFLQNIYVFDNSTRGVQIASKSSYSRLNANRLGINILKYLTIEFWTLIIAIFGIWATFILARLSK
jgi:hypothetical protein